MEGSHIIVEIKARCADIQRARKVLEKEKAEFRGLDHQVDTYFKVGSGRLKLREGEIENALIFYNRKNKTGPKESKVTLFKTGKDSPLKEILTKSLGVLTRVDKQREIYFIENVKFHLDILEDFGTFIEIEAIGDGLRDRQELLKQCEYYLDLFNIYEEDLVPGSYSDLYLDRKK
ncbi:MAG: class IV adenylate cyclase [Candidatus Adiutricales bacterium]